MGRTDCATGFVDWPKAGGVWTDSGEGGMWVYAFWLAKTHPPDLEFRWPDPFIACHGVEATVCLPLPDSIVSDNPEQIYFRDFDELPDRDADPEGYTIGVMDSGYQVIAAVCLGSTGNTWLDDQGRHWQCRPETLNSRGRALIVALNALYDREPVLVTYLDT